MFYWSIPIGKFDVALPTGYYFLEIIYKKEYQSTIRATATIKKYKRLKKSEQLIRLKDSLKNDPFFQHFQLTSYYDSKTEFMLPRTLDLMKQKSILVGKFRYSRTSDSLAIIRVLHHLQRDERPDTFYFSARKPKYFKNDSVINIPRVFVELTIEGSEQELYDYAEKEWKYSSRNVWNPVFTYIKQVFNIKYDDILLGVTCHPGPASDGGGVVSVIAFNTVEPDTIQAVPLGSTCMGEFLSEKPDIPKYFTLKCKSYEINPSSTLYNKLFPNPTDNKPAAKFHLGEEFEKYIKQVHFPGLQPLLHVEDRTPFSSGVTIRGLKNIVNNGTPKHWEMVDLFLSISLEGENKKMLKLCGGGKYVIGGNSYPRDSQFTSFLTDKDNINNLESFVNNLASNFFTYLNK